MVSHRHRCLFIHIPKVAGQSIEDVFIRLHNLTWKTRAPLLLRPNHQPELGPPRLAHLKAIDYVRYCYITPQEFNSYFKFSFIRNPWDRAVSFYKYLGTPEKHSFKEFLLEEFKNHLWKERYWFVGPQSEFVCGTNGKPLVDFIGRFENLQDDFNHVCRQLGLSPLELPHRNKSKSRNLRAALRPKVLLKRLRYLSQGQGVRVLKSYEDYYDDECRDFVAELYRNDIEFFEYRFGKKDDVQAKALSRLSFVPDPL